MENYLNEVSCYFKPTKQNVRIEDFRGIGRKDGWITNGLWAIKEGYEPNFITEIREKNKNWENANILEVVYKVIYAKKKEMRLTNTFELSSYKLYSIFRCSDFISKVNPYFVSMFGKYSGSDIHFYQENKTSPILVDIGTTSIGVIMPIIY
jgi:hypothetical protein